MHMRGKVFIGETESAIFPETRAKMTYSQRQGSSTFGVDEEESRDSGHDLNSAIAERCVQGLLGGVADIFENR